MDFVVGLPLTTRKYDSNWVIVDRFMKSTYYILVHTCYKTRRFAELYIERILCLHGVPNTTISDRGAQFVAHFWEQLHDSLGTQLFHNLAYHP
jgi:bacterioferritin (cytochrome b1)